MSRESDTLRALISTYFNSAEFSNLALRTKEAYQRQLESLCEWQMPTLKAPFGSLKISQIGNKTIQSAYDKTTANVARNRKFTCLKTVFGWGIQRFDGVNKNPVIGLKMMREKPRDRYVSNTDYEIIYNLAPKTLQLMMDGAYLLRLRRCEVSDLRRKININQSSSTFSGVTEEGILIHRAKGSWGGLVVWSERLRDFVQKCNKHNRDKATPWLIRTTSGEKVSKSNHDSYWRRVWIRARNEFEAGRVDYIPEHFTFHDLKAKGVTDHPNKEGGHKSNKMKEVYDRENRVELPTK